jgi:hypothetical protein
MTHFWNNRPEAEVAREARTPVRPPEKIGGGVFQGWGPRL